MESSTCGPISRVRAVGGEWRETPPAAVIYHAVPCRAVHTYTTMMIHGGGKAGRRLSLVLIDVIDIGIRRRADYSAVNNSTPLCRRHRCYSLPTSSLVVSIGTGVPHRHFTTTTTTTTTTACYLPRPVVVRVERVSRSLRDFSSPFYWSLPFSSAAFFHSFALPRPRLDLKRGGRETGEKTNETLRGKRKKRKKKNEKGNKHVSLSFVKNI